MLRVLWPIEDPRLFNSEAIDLARADLRNVAAASCAVIVGQPEFRVIDCTAHEWPATDTAVLCEVDAVPATRRIEAAA
jgi:hypothetical protein